MAVGTPCPHAAKLGIPARAADEDIMATLQELVDHLVSRGANPQSAETTLSAGAWGGSPP